MTPDEAAELQRDMEREARERMTYPEYRAWWCALAGNPLPKRRKADRVKPEPGVIDAGPDPENG